MSNKILSFIKYENLSDYGKTIFNYLFTKKKNSDKQILDPLTTVIKLALLYFYDNGTKLLIHDNSITLQEPDIFHEVYGHTPLLTNKAYGDFMEKFGKIALEADPRDRRRLFRLFWFTIEFGLLKTSDGLKAYGGGILSSIGETQYCLTDESKKQEFDSLEVLRTPYRIDIMQPMYFVLEEFDQLFSILNEDIIGLIQKSKELGDREPLFPPKTIEESEDVGMGAMKC